MLVAGKWSFIIITILNNKAIISQNDFMLKYICGNITNQNRPEINNSNWLLEKKYIINY